MFDQYNTDGYTQNELDALNAEFEQRVAELNLTPNTNEYDFQQKSFADEIARR